jgi:hypothetical protein
MFELAVVTALILSSAAKGSPGRRSFEYVEVAPTNATLVERHLKGADARFSRVGDRFFTEKRPKMENNEKGCTICYPGSSSALELKGVKGMIAEGDSALPFALDLRRVRQSIS